MRTRVTLATATLGTLALLLGLMPGAPGASAQPAPAASSDVTAAASERAVDLAGLDKLDRRKNRRFKATIRTTKHGIPHITAGGFGGLGYGSGYAAAEYSICTLMDTVITGRGHRSRYFGAKGRYEDYVTLDANNLQVDALATDIRNRKIVRKIMRTPAGPGKQAREMVRGYVAGVNRWLREHPGRKVTDRACRGKAYMKPNVKVIDLWHGVYFANLLASTGVFVKEIVDAEPATLEDPGLPVGAVTASDFTAAEREELLAGLGRDPESAFGSNATAIGSEHTSTRRGMLLGNPHFPWRGRYHFTQQHLTIPGKYNVAGASLIGSPAVNIGWNDNVAWSHTVSTAYRFTPYEFRTPTAGTTYVTDAGLKSAERRFVKVKVRTGSGLKTVTEDLYRVPQGYVLDAPDLLMGWTPGSFWAFRDVNAEHLRTIDVFLEMGKGKNVRDLLRRQDKAAGMPWVNTTAADRAGRVMYADHSIVSNVPTALAQQCMTPVGRVLDQVAGLPGLDGTRADSTCEWQTDTDAQRPGIFGPRNLPVAIRRDWVINANNSYWLPNTDTRLEGFADIIGCEQCERHMRTRMVMQYVIDRIASGRRHTPQALRRHQHDNRMRTAEVMSAGGALDATCDATGETEACAVLARWDRKSNRGSRGTHIFEEFVRRLPADGVWLTPFSAADPVNTPRGLNTLNPQVQQAMADAIDSLRQRGVPFDARWGDLQVAGDRGASKIGLGGGDGDAFGNANVLSSRSAIANRDAYKPITYGSSHIQAIAFGDKGRINARTILTYGQQENPRARFHQDQTKLFANKKWVKFAWTDKQIERDLISRQRIQGR